MGGRGCIVSATHTEQDIDRTVEAYEDALSAMRNEGII
jgi:glutamate-1-semialdehyde aminotransferase